MKPRPEFQRCLTHKQRKAKARNKHKFLYKRWQKRFK